MKVNRWYQLLVAVDELLFFPKNNIQKHLFTSSVFPGMTHLVIIFFQSLYSFESRIVMSRNKKLKYARVHLLNKILKNMFIYIMNL